MPRKTAGTTAKKAEEQAEDNNLDANIEAAQAAPRRGRAPMTFGTLTVENEYHNVVLWGREGSGKTTAAADAANHGKVVVINAEGGLKIRALQRQGINTDNLMVWPDPAAPVPITHRTLDRLYRQIKSSLDAEPGSIYAVIFDSVSEVVTAMLSFVADDRITKAAITDQVDRFETNRNDYGIMYKMFRDLLRKFRDLPCHVILTALERRDEDEDTRKVVYGPDINPGIQKDLAGYVDVVLYFRAADAKRPFRAVARGQERYRTKDRFGTLPDVLAEPSWTRMLAYIDEEISEIEDPLQAALVIKAKKEQEDTPDEDDDETDD